MTTPVIDASGYRALMRLSFPLIMTMALGALMHAIDQIFLGRVGAAAAAASFPAHISGYIVMCVFASGASYVSTFAAQHRAADEHREVGAMLRPSLWLALIGGITAAALIPFAPELFRIFGTEELVHAHLVTLGTYYFLQVLPAVALHAANGLLGGIDRPGLVLLSGAVGFVANVIFNWLLIFGYGPIPAMGVAGAGLGTVLASILACAVGFGALAMPGIRRQWHLFTARARASHYRRYYRFALPHALRELVEISAWQVFAVVVAHFGTNDLAACNAVLRWNLLFFIPLVGLGQGIGILASHALGQGDANAAHAVMRRGLHVASAWAAFMALLYLLAPGPLLRVFIDPATVGDAWPAMQAAAAPLFVIAALWCVGDVVNVCLRAVLSGAGDTTWPAVALGLTAIFVYVLPCIGLLLAWQHGLSLPASPMTIAWLISLAFVTVLAVVFAWRYRSGQWRKMSVR